MSKIEGLKSTILKQDIALAKKLQFVNKWKEKLNFDDDDGEEKSEKSKFQSHPRTLDSDSEECSQSNDSSTSSIHATTFKENIIRQTLQSKLIVKDFTDILQESFEEIHGEPEEEVTKDYIFGGDTLNFAENYQKMLKEKRTKKYVEDKIEQQLTRQRKTKVKIVEPKAPPIRKKMKIISRKSSEIQKNDMVDSVFDTKFRSITEKTIATINDIFVLLDKGIDKPDGEEDYLRRSTRVKEFSSRFVRNCLYPLNQQSHALDDELKTTKNTNHKLINCYQLVFQGVHSYLNHLPTSVGNCAVEKLKLLMLEVIKICDIHAKLIKQPSENVVTDYVYALKVHVDKLLKKIDEFSKTINSFKPHVNNKVNKNVNQMKLQSRFAMYTNSAFYRKDLPYRKTIEMLNKKKVNVKSKYKTATFKHRPPIEKSEEQRPKFVLGNKPSKTTQSSPMESARIDDNIQTQVDRDNSAPFPSPKEQCSNEKMIHEDVKLKLLQLVQNRAGEEVGKASDIEDGEVSEMLHNYFRKKEGKEILEVLARELQKEHINKTANIKVKDDNEETRQNSSLERKLSGKVHSNIILSERMDGTPRSRKEPTITVSGPKNAKLICITDDNSIIEPPNNEPHLTTKDSCTKCTTIIDPGNMMQPGLKMVRMMKTFRSLTFFSDNHAINIIEYKLKFRNACKKNPLYMKTTNIQPWILMGKLSDQIFDYAALQVANEIELSNIPDQVYQEEMQL